MKAKDVFSIMNGVQLNNSPVEPAKSAPVKPAWLPVQTPAVVSQYY